MKQTILLFMILITGFSFGQRLKYTEYYNSYENKKYSIFINYRSPEKYNISVGLPSNDIIAEWVYVEVNNKNINDFRNSFFDAEKKFNEWKTISENEKINDVSKPMKINSKDYNFSFVYGDTLYTTRSRSLDFKYSIEKGISYLIFYVNGLVSPTNSYMRMNGFTLRFKDNNDVNDFLSVVDNDKISEFIRNDIKNKSLLN